MFGFRKSVKERIEPGFDKDSSSTQEQDKSIADILGAEENDTNITAGVDAILDEEATLDSHQTEINQNIDLSSLETPQKEFSETDELTEELAERFNENQESPSEEPVSPDMDWNTEPESTEVSGIDSITETQPVENTEEFSDVSAEEPFEDSSASSPMEETQENFDNYPEQEETTKSEEDSSIPSFFNEGVKDENDVLPSEEFSNTDADENNQNDDFGLEDFFEKETEFSVDDIAQEDVPLSTVETFDNDENQNPDFMDAEQTESSDYSENESFEDNSQSSFDVDNLQEEIQDDSLTADDLPALDDLQNEEPFSIEENLGTEEESSFENNDASDDSPSLDNFQNEEPFAIDENLGEEEAPSFENSDISEDLPALDDLQNEEPFSVDENLGAEEEPSFENSDVSENLPALDDFQNEETVSFDEKSDSEEISVEDIENSDDTSFLTENDDMISEDEDTEVVSEENTPKPDDESKPFTVSEGSYESYDDTISEDSVTVDLDNELWTVGSLDDLSENPKVINYNSGSVTWGGDKYQSDLKIEIDNIQEIENWNVMVLHDFSVPLDASATELVIEKAPDVVRFASLMHKGQEKLKVFNQSSYKFIAPQGEFFAVQGNVICGHVDKTFSLNIHDYVRLPVQSALNKYVAFKQPASGFVLGPKGVTVFFATARGVAFVVKEKLPEAEIFEYEPSLKKFDSRKNFVYDEQSGTTEFMATGKQNCLVINTGASLYGWNIRFDNEMFLSLKDTLTYQAKQNALPSPNGELIHDGKIFKFFGIEKIQARPKVLYYSYGKV